MRLQRFFLIVSPILVCAISLSAQTDSCLRRVVPVNVLTEKGDLVSGLTAENFVASLHDGRARILSVTAIQETPRVAVLIDRSTSMGGVKGLWETNLSAAMHLVQALPIGSLVSITTFADKVQELLPFTDDRAQLQATLKGLQAEKPHGHTALWDALEDVLAQFPTPQRGDAVYLISDGQDNESKRRAADIRKNLIKHAARLFVFSIEEPPPPEVIMGNSTEADLPELIKATGGADLRLRGNFGGPVVRAFPALADKAGNPTEAGRLLLRQLPLIFSYDAVVIELPKTASKEQHLDLKLEGLTERHLILAYPHTLAACETRVAANSIPKN